MGTMSVSEALKYFSVETVVAYQVTVSQSHAAFASDDATLSPTPLAAVLTLRRVAAAACHC